MVDDETLFRTMQVAAETGALVMVHAENGDAIEVLVTEALAAGNTDPIYHALTRPPETEGEATNRAIQLARVAGSPLYVVHVSCAESVEPLALAREKGWDVHGETCTQYFFIDQTFLERPTSRARSTSTRRRRATRRTRTCSGTRCAPTSSRRSRPTIARTSSRAEGPRQERLLADPERRTRAREPAAHDPRVRRAHGPDLLNRMVALLATNPAKLFGLYPRKGTLAVGSDADIVVFDPEKQLTISAATHHSRSDYNLYEGTEVTGSPEVVLLRGNVLVEGDELVAKPGTGQFIKRARFGEELKPAALAGARA